MTTDSMVERMRALVGAYRQRAQDVLDSAWFESTEVDAASVAWNAAADQLEEALNEFGAEGDQRCWPPGETIREVAEIRGMTIDDLGRALNERLDEGDEIPSIEGILNGSVPIDGDIACRLQTVLGVNASFWLSLYRLWAEDVERRRNEARNDR